MGFHNRMPELNVSGLPFCRLPDESSFTKSAHFFLCSSIELGNSRNVDNLSGIGETNSFRELEFSLDGEVATTNVVWSMLELGIFFRFIIIEIQHHFGGVSDKISFHFNDAIPD
jgi:hypothetical protein